jgi:glycosyltransferase involved in cell wall biosynthesis
MSVRRRAALFTAGLTAAVGVAAALAYTTPPAVYAPYMAAVLVAEAVVVVRTVKRRMVETGSASLRELVSPRDRRQRQRREEKARRLHAELQLLRDRLKAGFTRDTVDRLEAIAADAKAPLASRSVAARVLADWRERPAPAVDAAVLADGHFDVLFVSNFNLGGGTTQSNRNEIAMLRAAGKRVGLIHHPLYQMHSARPVNAKIMNLVDGERVRLIEGAPKLSCDLLLMRFPPFAERLRDDLPEIDADRKVLIVNQAPMTYYSLGTGHRPVWDVATVHRNLRGWIGEHHWRTVGPLVHQALVDCHGKELRGVDLSEEHWYPSFDTAASQRRDEAPVPAVARVGRHSRDHVSKWPELAADLRRAYPERDDIAIRVLGGADIPRRILGRLPRNWSATAFDSADVGEFLRDLDFYVYFVNSTLLEAFGRAPVEAMAAGVPTILPPRFRPVFGDGALYAEPDAVAPIIDDLRGDRYLRQRRIGLDTVERLFSHEAHRGRFRSLGIDL